MAYNHASRTRATPAREYFAPAVSLLLSLPTLLVVLALGAFAGYHALSGQMIDLGVLQPFLQWPLTAAFSLLYFVFGPMAGIVLCLIQRARVQQTSGEAHVLGRQPTTLNVVALRVAAVSLGVVMLLVALGMTLRGGT